MSAAYKVHTFTKQAGTGSQSVVGVGFEPTWVMLLWNGSAAAGVLTDGFEFGMGHGDGALQAARYACANDGSSNPDASYCIDFDGIFIKSGPVSNATGTAPITDLASLSSLDADGFTLNWLTNSGTTEVVVAVCGNGPAKILQPSITTGASGSVAGAGFQPTALMLLGMNFSGDISQGNEFALYFGVCDSSLNQFWINNIRPNNLPQEGGNFNNVSSIFGGINIAGGFVGGSPTGRIIISSLDADGFTYSGTGSTSPATLKQSFLCLGGVQSHARSQGNAIFENPVALGFTPGLVLHMAGSAGFSVGASDGSSQHSVTARLSTSVSASAKVLDMTKTLRALNTPQATATSTTDDITAETSFGASDVTWTFTNTGTAWALYLEAIDDPVPTDSEEESPESITEPCCAKQRVVDIANGRGIDPLGVLPPWTASCVGGGQPDGVADLSAGEIF